jgi:mono/diheme cytochrome c family protein
MFLLLTTNIVYTRQSMRFVLMIAMASCVLAQERAATSTREFLGLGAAPDAAAAKKGEPLYQANCAGCHGQNARGAQAPDLLRSVTVLHDEKDEEIGEVIRKGRGAMPPFALSQDAIHDISQYLKLQVELTANRGTYNATYSALRGQTSGDASKGRAFFEAHCVACHAGDLAKIGAKYPQAATLQSRWIWPFDRQPPRAVVTVDGRTYEGSLLTFDDFDVALRDAGGLYHCWPRARATVRIDDRLAGHRALLAKYSDEDLHNVTAFLAGLK